MVMVNESNQINFIFILFQVYYPSLQPCVLGHLKVLLVLNMQLWKNIFLIGNSAINFTWW